MGIMFLKLCNESFYYVVGVADTRESLLLTCLDKDSLLIRIELYLLFGRKEQNPA